MSKKRKKPGATEKRPEDNPAPPEGCRYDPTSVQTIAIKENSKDEHWKTVQKIFWRKQSSSATCLNIVTAIGVLFTGIAAGGAVIYALITYHQWRDLRHNFEADERAWLKVEVGMPPTLSSQTPVVVNVRNVGKSPALNLFGGVIVQIVDANSGPAFPTGGKTEFRQVAANMVFPSDLTSFSSGRTPNNPDGTLRPLTDEEMHSLAAGNTYLAAFGIIAYRDQFGDHWTRFCTPKSYQVGPKDFYWRSCILWNAVGDGLTKWGSPSDLK
jgi:hypothetical protein